MPLGKPKSIMRMDLSVFWIDLSCADMDVKRQLAKRFTRILNNL